MNAQVGRETHSTTTKTCIAARANVSLRRGARRYAVCIILLLTGCEQSFFMVGDKGREATIERLSTARDACLAKHATADVSADAATVARAAALACSEQTERLAAIVNRDGDPKVAAAIRENSEFRAMGYVLRARGVALF